MYCGNVYDIYNYDGKSYIYIIEQKYLNVNKEAEKMEIDAKCQEIQQDIKSSAKHSERLQSRITPVLKERLKKDCRYFAYF